MVYRFGEYELDAAALELRRSGSRVPMEPQVFDVLAYLVKHGDRTVSKDELLDNVWKDRYISESAVSSRIMAARRAIGDDGKSQRLIKTVHGRGFRFQAPPSTSEGRTLHAVGRSEELGLMRFLLEEARAGRRSTVIVCGTAGVGKTTLVRDFLVEASADCTVVFAFCNGSSADGEAFCPLLMAVSDLGTRQPGEGVLETVRRTAPQWSERIGWMSSERPSDARPSLREFVELIEALSNENTVVLAVDDLHWSDAATLEAVAYLVRRTASARVLVVATSRMDEPGESGRRAARTISELAVRGECKVIDLPALSRDAVEELLRRRIDDVDDDLVGAVHRRTGGHPLFLTAAIEEVAVHGREALMTLPATVRQFVEIQYSELNPGERDIVGAASCVGRDFCSMAVAAMLDTDPAVNEEACLELGRTGRFFARNGNEAISGGRVFAAFKFRHDIVFDVVHDLLPPAKRALWHKRFADWSIAAFDWEIERRAYGVARHYRDGADWENCVRWLAEASEIALRQGRSADAHRIAKEGIETMNRTKSGRSFEDRFAAVLVASG